MIVSYSSSPPSFPSQQPQSAASCHTPFTTRGQTYRIHSDWAWIFNWAAPNYPICHSKPVCHQYGVFWDVVAGRKVLRHKSWGLISSGCRRVFVIGWNVPFQWGDDTKFSVLTVNNFTLHCMWGNSSTVLFSYRCLKCADAPCQKSCPTNLNIKALAVLKARYVVYLRIDFLNKYFWTYCAQLK